MAVDLYKYEFYCLNAKMIMFWERTYRLNVTKIIHYEKLVNCIFRYYKYYQIVYVPQRFPKEMIWVVVWPCKKYIIICKIIDVFEPRKMENGTH